MWQKGAQEELPGVVERREEGWVFHQLRPDSHRGDGGGGIPKAWVLWGQMKHGKGAEAWAGESA